jgi:adenylate kinase family enzyme
VWLREDLAATVLRLREFADATRRAGTLSADLFARRDCLGWFPDDTVAYLLDVALDQHLPPNGTRLGGPGLMVWENFPGSARQLILLHKAATRRRVPVGVLELAAADWTLDARVRDRRVCGTCDPDQPHQPAVADPGHTDRCRRCGGTLQRRDTDEPGRHAARLARYRGRVAAIRSTAHRLHLPYEVVNADQDPSGCTRAAVAAVNRLGVHPATRHPAAPVARSTR